ncbi:hypothetical protein J437_LFUL008201 [Ladona fulva]|uniref:Major facilitator superfamily (MFS) profile domain-containing protein n=1 Tax=Ladona fulva TaxID=123851 RepID=A0A8K0K5I4_LADFU|nr:hypothetical protein J437_LFUL008201 [Ladona fulva]
MAMAERNEVDDISDRESFVGDRNAEDENESTISDLLDVTNHPYSSGEDPSVIGRCTRSQSESAFLQKRYTPREIRRIRERLLRTQLRPNPRELKNFTRSQRLTLLGLAIVDFVTFCSMSVMAPFFPKEAALKGVTNTMSGFVFSFYALIMFLSSPVFGKLLPHVGARFLYMTGMFVAGCCSVLFGLLGYIEDSVVFTAYCLVVRGTEALGAAAYSTASYTFVAEVFPDNMGSVMGILETFVGLGMSVGPALGGLLYSLGGFGLPFYVLGVLMVVIVPVNFFLLPAGYDHDVEVPSGSIIKMLKVPSVAVTSFFQLTTEQMGLIFLLFSAVYAISSPIWGWVADRITNHWLMMFWGLLASTAGLLLMGPSPLIPGLQSTLWLNLVSLSILGVAVALTLLPTYQGVLDNAIEGGCRDDLSTYSLVGGIWSCMYSLGEVIGPFFGGVVIEYYGFPLCSTIMAAMTLLLAIVTLFFYSLKNDRPTAKPTPDVETDSCFSGPVSHEHAEGESSTHGEKSPLLCPQTRIATKCNNMYGTDVEAARSAPSLTVTAPMEDIREVTSN